MRGWVCRLQLLQSFSGPSLAGLMTIFYCLRLKTLPTWRARSPYLYPPVSEWPGYTPQALGSLFVSSYDSQGYPVGRAIQPRSGPTLLLLLRDVTAYVITQSLHSNGCTRHVSWQFRYCCVRTLPSNGCFSASTVLALSKYATVLFYDIRLGFLFFFQYPQRSCLGCKKLMVDLVSRALALALFSMKFHFLMALYERQAFASQVCSAVAWAARSWTYIKFSLNSVCFRVSTVFSEQTLFSHCRYSATMQEKNVLTFYVYSFFMCARMDMIVWTLRVCACVLILRDEFVIGIWRNVR
jgi:hypothetical protein